MQSVFAAVRLLHGGLTLAYCLQAADGPRRGRRARLARQAPLPLRGGGAGDGHGGPARQPLPARLRFDAAGDPLAWIAREGLRSGFAPGEKSVLAFAYVLPLFSRIARGKLGPSRRAPGDRGVILFSVEARSGAGEPRAVRELGQQKHCSPPKNHRGTYIRATANRRRAGREDDVAPAPGKTCGPCTLCCSALEIAELKKPAGPACAHCAARLRDLRRRPQVCRDFECDWLTDRALPRHLAPRSGRRDPDGGGRGRRIPRGLLAAKSPLAWRNPLVFAHLVKIAKSGRTVVAKAGFSSWRIFASGEWGPTV